MDKKKLPETGWDSVRVEDLGEVTFTCEKCGERQLRFVHVLRHKDVPGFEFRVGSRCASKLTGDPEGVKLGEKKARRNAEAKKRRKRILDDAKKRFMKGFKPYEGDEKHVDYAWEFCIFENRVRCDVRTGFVGGWGFRLSKAGDGYSYNPKDWVWKDDKGVRFADADDVKEAAWNHLLSDADGYGLTFRAPRDGQVDMTYTVMMKEYRERNGLKQAELAALMGVGPSCISYWETGTIIPEKNHFAKFLALLSEEERQAAKPQEVTVEKEVLKDASVAKAERLEKFAELFPEAGVDGTEAYILGLLAPLLRKPGGIDRLAALGFRDACKLADPDSPFAGILKLTEVTA